MIVDYYRSAGQSFGLLQQMVYHLKFMTVMIIIRQGLSGGN
jgi:hypothetical protein